VVEMLDVSRATVYRWIEDGTIPCMRVGETCRIPVEPLRELLPKDPPAPSLLSHFVLRVSR